MDNIQTPVQVQVKRPMTYGTKALLLGLQCCLLMIGTLVVWVILDSREGLSDKVAGQIAKEWGGKVEIATPTIQENPDTAVRLYPETFNCKATVETQTLHRSIYEAEVFNARVAISGSFNTDKVAADSMYVRLTVNPGQIVKLSPLTIGGKSINWEQSDSYIYAKIDSTAQPDTLEFATDFDIHGS